MRTAYITAVSAICTHEITSFIMMTTPQRMYRLHYQFGLNGYNFRQEQTETGSPNVVYKRNLLPYPLFRHDSRFSPFLSNNQNAVKALRQVLSAAGRLEEFNLVPFHLICYPLVEPSLLLKASSNRPVADKPASPPAHNLNTRLMSVKG